MYTIIPSVPHDQLSNLIQANRVVVASVDGKGLILVEFEERQKLKQVEDKILDVKTVLDSTLDTVSSLIEKYTDLTKAEDVTFSEPTTPQRDFILFALQEKKREIVLIRKKIDVLHAKVQGTTKLVSLGPESGSVSNLFKLSGLLDHGNGLALRDLAVQAKHENEVMRQLTEKGTRDAAAVKVLTVITLIYLPATVVSVSIRRMLFGWSNISCANRTFILLHLLQPSQRVTRLSWYI